MSEQRTGEARHPATPSRIARAVADGQIYKSQQTAIAVQTLASFGALLLCAAAISAGLVSWTREYWGSATTNAASLSPVVDSLLDFMSWCGIPLLVAFGAVWISGWLSWLLQMGIHFGKRPLLSPQGFQIGSSLKNVWSPERVLSNMNGIAQFGLSLGLCVYLGIGNTGGLVTLYTCSPDQWGQVLIQTVLIQLWPLLVVIVVGSAIDWYCQRVFYYRRLAMTDQELREEQRNESGAQTTRRRRNLTRAT